MYGKLSKVLNSPDLGLLVLRLVFGGSMMTHGIPKLMSYPEKSETFANPFGLGSAQSLILVIFAEVFCSIAVALGFFTRMAVIPIIITMATAAFIIHRTDGFGKQELPLVYLAGFILLLLCGSGRFAVKPD